MNNKVPPPPPLNIPPPPSLNIPKAPVINFAALPKPEVTTLQQTTQVNIIKVLKIYFLFIATF